jgi:4-amino-4-deoxy-L-arabinose transferase-like glycosyltransferase
VSTRASLALAAGLWLVLVLASLWARPLLPVDETRYLSVAWEMWARGDFLVPHLNGAPYAHKPPLLFWLIHLGWAVFGVNDWTARLVAPLFGLASLFLAAGLARRLWPVDRQAPGLAVLLLLGALVWAAYGTATLFDMLVVFFALVGITGLVKAAGGASRYWLLFGIAVGGGILSKGPVILLTLLPPALLAPWWTSARPAGGWPRWYLSLGGGVAIGAAMALAWALPAAVSGGSAYREAIFWGQTAGRMVDSFAHARPWWWYLPLLPALLFPWSVWPPFFRGLARLGADPGVRLCLAWGLPAFLTLSLISGKQVHYLLPVFPAIMLPAAVGIARLSDRPDRRPGRPAAAGVAAVFLLLGLLLLARPWLVPLIPDLAWLDPSSPIWGAPPALAGLGLLLWRPRSAARAVPVLTALVAGALMLVQMGPLQAVRDAYDLRPLAREVARVQAEGAPVAHFGRYRNEFHFLGRLEAPFSELDTPEELLQWAREHPDGYVVARLEAHLPALADAALYLQRYRGDQGGIWRARTLLVHPELVEPLR